MNCLNTILASAGSSVDTDSLKSFFESLGDIALKQWLIALGILIGLLIISHFLIRLFVKKLKKSERISRSLHKVLVTAVRFLLILASILVAGNIVGVSVSTFMVVFGVFGAAIALAAQGILSNVVGCIILLSGRLFEVDDYIETSSGSGTVLEINLLNTKLRSYEGHTIYIPNSVLYTETVTNMTSYKKRRANIAFRVSNVHSPGEVREAALDAASKIPEVLNEPAPLLVVSGYTAGHVNYTFLVWGKAEDYWTVRNGVTEQLYASFRERGIEMTNKEVSSIVTD